MTRYLISFNDGAMDHITDEELPDVGKAAHAVIQDAENAGVFVFGAGLERQRASVVATDGMVTDGPYPETKAVIGGSRDELASRPLPDDAAAHQGVCAGQCHAAAGLKNRYGELIVGSNPTPSAHR